MKKLKLQKAPKGTVNFNPKKPKPTPIAKSLREVAKYVTDLEQKPLNEAVALFLQRKKMNLAGLLEALADVEEAGC